MKRTVSDLLKQESLCRLPSVDENENLAEALIALKELDVCALLVLSGGAVVGVFSERDYARASASGAISISALTRVKDLMNRNIVYVTEDYRLDECMAIMAKLKIHHLTVLQGDTPRALLNARHIMEALVEDQKFMVNQLVTYITGSNVIEPQMARQGLIGPEDEVRA